MQHPLNSYISLIIMNIKHEFAMVCMVALWWYSFPPQASTTHADGSAQHSPEAPRQTPCFEFEVLRHVAFLAHLRDAAGRGKMPHGIFQHLEIQKSQMLHGAGISTYSWVIYVWYTFYTWSHGALRNAVQWRYIQHGSRCYNSLTLFRSGLNVCQYIMA